METDNCCVSPVALEPDNIETLFQLHPSAHGQCQPPPPLVAPVTAANLCSPPASPLRRHVSPPPAALTTRDPNWQSTKCSVRERNAAMFNNSLMADIYFLVGQPTESVKRYRYALDYRYRYNVCLGSVSDPDPYFFVH